MSLSFVKSAVLSSTDGVSHNEEITIDNKETQSLRASGGGSNKPLFEQLRANKDAEQEKNDEFQRSLRGTRTLDDEDCAHLDSIERVKDERAYAVKSEMEREVALFHAAREDRGLAQTVMVVEGGDNGDVEDSVGDDAITKAETGIIAAKKESKKIVPKFTIKKKRKRVSQESDSKNTETKQVDVAQKKKSNESEASITKGGNEIGTINSSEETKQPPVDSDSDNEGGGLLGLGCYGSDSD